MEHIKEQMVDICQKMWQLGWVAANDGNISVRLPDGTFLATPTGVSKSMITADTLVHIDHRGQLVSPHALRPSSEIKMHLKCYADRPDVHGVVHAHPPTATAYAVAGVHMDRYTIVETIIAIGAIPITPYGTPSTEEVPNAIEPYLQEHDVLLLQNHGALTMGSDLLTAYYRMETLELYAKISLNAHLLGGERELPRTDIERLIGMRKDYQVTGKHPGFKRYRKDSTGE